MSEIIYHTKAEQERNQVEVTRRRLVRLKPLARRMVEAINSHPGCGWHEVIEATGCTTGDICDIVEVHRLIRFDGTIAYTDL